MQTERSSMQADGRGGSASSSQAEKGESQNKIRMALRVR